MQPPLRKELSNCGHNIIGCGRDISKLSHLKLPESQNHLLSQVDVSTTRIGLKT